MFSTVLIGFSLFGLPGRASADGYVAPFLGGAMGCNVSQRSASVGVAGGWLGTGWLGAEGDLSWAPDFFGRTGVLADRRLVTAMANVVVARPADESESEGHVQPYVSGGVGVLKPRLREVGGLFQLDANHLGMNAGGGAMIFFNRNVGARADLRYFRGLRHSAVDDANDFSLDLSTLHYWRISGGLAVRF